MDPALGGIFDAPSTAHSSGAASSVEAASTNTAEFGIRDGRTSSPSTALQRGRLIAAPATSISPVAERGRSRMSERSSRSTSIKVITTTDPTLKSKSRLPKPSLSPRGQRELTADEKLDIAINETLSSSGRARTPERIAVMDQPHLLASPDPLMQLRSLTLNWLPPFR